VRTEGLSDRSVGDLVQQERVEERKRELRDRQQELKARAGGVRERVSGATPDEAKRVASQVAHRAEERPLPAMGLALGAGLVLGWLVGRR
jgi:ElaB/YqjD/DUF883 family membrane-anchored ribosome-binding protein